MTWGGVVGHPRASYLHSMCLLHLSASRDTFPWTTHPHLLLGRPRVPLGDGFLGRTSSSLPLAQHWTLESVISPHHDVFTGLTLAQSSWKAGDGPSFFPRSRALPGSHHMLDGSCHYFFFFSTVQPATVPAAYWQRPGNGLGLGLLWHGTL